ncbi:MAG: DNA polymerase III subunit delta' [Candidatus Poribacteria bacterium]|nr:DNA polymerase III subunit delta' [Candidatus Poribacteria bacterium]
MQSPIVGHHQIIEQLHHAIASNRVAGAYLFAGGANVGKETVALHFAKSVNCLTSNEGACGTCLSCRKTDNGNHPDVQVIRPSGAWTRINQIRELQRRIVYRPLEGVRKVYILTEAERMNLEAANCLLKTLEEPPAESVLILLTANLDALLPTIRSRCQIINFQPLPVPELAAHLIQQFELEESHALSIATLSGGAVGKALTLLQENKAHFENEIPEIITTGDRLAAFRIAEKLSQNPEVLDHLVSWYRDLLLLHQGAPIDLLTHVYHIESLRRLTSRYSRLQLQSAIQTIFETKKLLTRNVNATLALEVMVLKLLVNDT